VLPETVVDDDELDLRAYLTVLRHRWKVIAGVAAIAIAATLALSLSQEASYRAESEVLVRQRGTETLFNDDQLARVDDAERQLNNEVRVLGSGAVRAAVADRYEGELDPDDVGATVSSDTSDVVEVSLTATDPDAAAELVNLYVATFIEVRRQQRVDELLAAGAEIQRQIDDIAARVAEVRAPLDDLEQQLAGDPGDSDLQAQRDALAEQLAPRLTPLESQRAFYENQLEQLQLTAGIAQSGGAQVLTPADVPESPVSPKPVRDAGIALVLGFVLGIGIAFLVDTLDERIRSISDLEQLSGGLPALALVPETDRRDPAFVAARDDAKSPAAEAYRSLRTAVKFASLEHPIKVLQITSPASGEGKTTTVANLAVALAQGGSRVVIVCCDLRRPLVHERFGVSLAPGLTDVLVGDAPLSEAVRRYDDKVYVLPAGSPPPNPSELLSTTNAGSVIRALSSEFDMVIVDSTPVLPVTDALVISRLVDATIVVVDSRTTARKGFRRTMQLLAQVNATVLGFVLNGLPAGGSYGYGYGYHGAADDERGARRAAVRPPRSGREVSVD
jgi:capsular exopolysaccharide synthesis family protein